MMVDVAIESVNLTGLYSDSRYNVTITAINGAGESDRSDPAFNNTDTIREYSLYIVGMIIQLPLAPPAPSPPVVRDTEPDGRAITITLTKPSSINGLVR